MDADFLSSLAGVGLSLAASYWPGFAGWFEGLEPTRKRLVMLALLGAAAGGVYGLACAGLAGWSCTPAGLLDLLRLFLAAALANQAAYQLSPRRAGRAAGG